MPRWFKVIAYPVWFLVVFVTTVYLTFPIDEARGAVVDAAEVALGRDSPKSVGRHGVNPEVQIGKLSLWRLSGVTAKRVKVRLASSDPDPGPEIAIDELNVRVGLLSLLTSQLEVSFAAQLYGGDVTGRVGLDREAVFDGKASSASLKGLELDAQGVKLDDILPLQEKLGAPLTGTLGLTANLELGEEPNKDAEGEILLSGTRLSLGPGNLKVSALFPVEVPLINLGKLEGRIPVEKGKGESQDLHLIGGDVTADTDLEISFSKRLELSRYSGDGTFGIEEKFVNENDKVKSLLGLAGQFIDKHKNDEGRYQFNYSGNFAGKPRGGLGASPGARGKGAKASRRRR